MFNVEAGEGRHEHHYRVTIKRRRTRPDCRARGTNAIACSSPLPRGFSITFSESENVKMNGRWAMRLAEKIFAECPIRSFIEECRSLRASGHAFA
jgi:hypothetical protein